MRRSKRKGRGSCRRTVPETRREQNEDITVHKQCETQSTLNQQRVSNLNRHRPIFMERIRGTDDKTRRMRGCFSITSVNLTSSSLLFNYTLLIRRTSLSFSFFSLPRVPVDMRANNSDTSVDVDHDRQLYLVTSVCYFHHCHASRCIGIFIQIADWDSRSLVEEFNSLEVRRSANSKDRRVEIWRSKVRISENLSIQIFGDVKV